jgi:hypothetical protein
VLELPRRHPEARGAEGTAAVDGAYRIDSTEVKVSADGLTATDGPTTKGSTTYAADSPQVRAANTSSCVDVPEVRTSGR